MKRRRLEVRRPGLPVVKRRRLEARLTCCERRRLEVRFTYCEKEKAGGQAYLQ